MDINLIATKYRSEMTGAFAILAQKVRDGQLTTGQFTIAQHRVYVAYLNASK